MRIGLVTITSGTNYGNRLQNYAVQKAVEKEDVKIETIKNYSSSKCKIFIKNMIKNALYGKNHRKREKCFVNFNKENINYSNFEIIKGYVKKDINDQYDYFICGSDQIWNPSYEENKLANFLSFSNYDKNISFAPSFGVSTIPNDRVKEYTEYLKNIKYISVREDAGKKIVEELTGRGDADVLVDPTMLLSSEEWDKVSKKPEQLKTDKYILNYFLGNIPEEWMEEINRIAKENECDVINILDKNSPFYQSGPSEFIYLEKNAFMVCTDSFHSCIFAIIYDTPFVNFARTDKTVSMNSRLETLLSKFNLQNRRFEGKISEDLLKCNYSDAKRILEEEREKSISFLRRALEL